MASRFFAVLLCAAGCESSLAPAPSVLQPAPTVRSTSSHRATSDYAGGGCFHAVDRPGGTPLQVILDDVGPTGMVVVDQPCTVDADLLIPDRFTLRGESWGGNGILEVDAAATIRFDDGGDGSTHTTVENLQIRGPGGFQGTAFTIDGRHQIHLRDLIISDFQVGVDGHQAFSVDVDDCTLHDNRVGLLLGFEANTWRIRGGICSQNVTCASLHAGTGGNDTLILGVRMESNDTAVRVAGDSTYIAFNRFEGNGTDIVRDATATGVAVLANNTAGGTTSDLSELNPGGLTALPDIDHALHIGIVPGTPTTQIGSYYVPGDNLLRTQLLGNQLTDDGVTIGAGYSDGYAGWGVELDGSALDATSAVRVLYRSPGVAGSPTELLRLGSDGVVEATGFVSTSDARRKTDFAPVDSALQRLTSLRGLTYAWADGVAAEGQSMGLLAQDVRQVFPTAVTTRGDTHRVDYAQLTAPIVESIKELAGDNAALRDENVRLQAILARLEARLDAMDAGSGAN